MTSLTIDFTHDVVCCRCFNTSSRMRSLADVLDGPDTVRAVETDRQTGRSLQVRSVPTLVVRKAGARLVTGPREDLAAQLRAALRLVA